MSTGQAPEKSSFSRRCSLLSRYLKEKGSFGNIDIELARKSDLELVGKLDLGAQQNAINRPDISEASPFYLTKKLSGGETSTSSGGKPRDAALSEPRNLPEPKSSQLTIFFGGQVLVYNEFPQDKVKEIVEAAKEAKPVAVDSNNIQKVAVDSNNTQKGAVDSNNIQKVAVDSNNTHKIVVDSNNTQKAAVVSNNTQKGAVDLNNTQNHMNLDMNVRDKSNVVIPDLNEPTSSGNDHQTKEQSQVVERIARRASLHRFFAKRKDRAVARAPYQVNQNGGHLPPKPQMVGPSVDPGQHSQQPATPPKPMRHNDMSMEVDEEEGRCSKDLELKL